MRNHPDALSIDQLLLDHHPTSGLSEHHDQRRAVAEVAEDSNSIGRWLLQDGMERDRHGHREIVDQLECVLSGIAAEDAVLMLDQYDVDTASGLVGLLPRRSRQRRPAELS
jgi:hypothetical protein